MCFLKKDENEYILFSTALRINMLKQVSHSGTLYKSLANLDPHDLPLRGEQHYALAMSVLQQHGGRVRKPTLSFSFLPQIKRYV